MSGNHRKTKRFTWGGAAFILSASLLPGFAHADDDWNFGGGNLHNTRSADSECKLKVSNVAGLKKKWEFVTHGEVSATPTVEGNKLFAVDWGGYLYSLDRDTGVPHWSHQLKDYTGNTVQSVSRTSPAIVDDNLIIGDQGDTAASGFTQGGGTTASVMAINKHDGTLAWRTVVSDHPFSAITSSPVAHCGVIYVGISSLEENAGFIPGYPGYSWRGKVVALDARTGAFMWKKPFITIDDASYSQGYTGASVWGSTPVVDERRGLLYVSTGNNYSAPAGHTSPGGSAAPAGDHLDSILALDLNTGKLKWAFRAWNGDKWDVASWVRAGSPLYMGGSTDLGPDWDFGSGPNLFNTRHGEEYLGAGAKSGIYYSLDPDTGRVVWQTQVGPGGTGGGIEWGSAVDGKRIYCAIANSDSRTTALHTTAGLWVALDPQTGQRLWSTADPLGGHDFGMVTIANGVMFAASAGTKPNAFVQPPYPGSPGGFFALDASNGKILWQFTIADDPGMGSVICGPSVVDGTVYWGSGYSHLSNAFGIRGALPKLYAFSVNDKGDGR